ncbi:MAG: hypothetical protein KA419_14675 [Acidobacteria bacterium]|nr:hypothetical protein [Acidobacteriota bacterium]
MPTSGACPACGFDPVRRPWRTPALPPGTALGSEYRLGRVLGKGGFGITYVVSDVNLERRVAVKEFFPQALAARGTDQTTAVAVAEGRFGNWRKRFLDEDGRRRSPPESSLGTEPNPHPGEGG